MYAGKEKDRIDAVCWNTKGKAVLRRQIVKSVEAKTRDRGARLSAAAAKATLDGFGARFRKPGQ